MTEIDQTISEQSPTHRGAIATTPKTRGPLTVRLSLAINRIREADSAAQPMDQFRDSPLQVRHCLFGPGAIEVMHFPELDLRQSSREPPGDQRPVLGLLYRHDEIGGVEIRVRDGLAAAADNPRSEFPSSPHRVTVCDDMEPGEVVGVQHQAARVGSPLTGRGSRTFQLK